MIGVLCAAIQVILAATALKHSIITAMAMSALSRIVQRKFSHQKHHTTMTGHAPNHVITTAKGTDPSPFITDAAK